MFEGKLTPRGKSTNLDISGPSILQSLNFAHPSLSVAYIVGSEFFISAPKSGCVLHSLKRIYISRGVVHKDTKQYQQYSFALNVVTEQISLLSTVNLTVTDSRLIPKLTHKPQKRGVALQSS